MLSSLAYPMHSPPPSYRVELSGFPSPLDAFDTQQPPLAFPDVNELHAFASLHSSASPARPRLSPNPHSPQCTSTLLDHSIAQSLPPSMSLFPSMSAIGDASVSDRCGGLLKLEQLHEPVALSRPAFTPPSIDEQWPTDVPLSSMSASAMSLSHSSSSSSSSSSSGSRSQLGSPASRPQPIREQRKLSKRLKQRRADLHRRNRETAALSEMKELMAAAKHITSNHDGSNTAGEEAETPHRVQILESSAARMRELQLLVNLLSQTCDTQQQEIHALSDRVDKRDGEGGDRPQRSTPSFSVFQRVTGLDLSSAAAPSKRMRLLASSMSSTVNSTLGHQSLQQARLAPVVLSLVLMECATGLVLDVNDGMLAQGWQRDQLVGRALMEGYDAVMDEKGWQLRENLYRQIQVPPSADGELKLGGRQAQYERSKRLIRELYAGKIGMCVALWRVYLTNGLLYEVEKSTWIDGWEAVVDAKGGVSRRPLRAVSVTAYADARRIE